MPERREKQPCRVSQQRCREAEPQSKTSDRLTLPLERTATANSSVAHAEHYSPAGRTAAAGAAARCRRFNHAIAPIVKASSGSVLALSSAHPT